MQTPFALRRRAGDSSKSKSLDGEKSTAKSRASRGPLLVIVAGVFLVVCHSFAEDYAQAIVAPNGLYIPRDSYVIPTGTPVGEYIHKFRIYNARPWATSLEAKADCGCTGLSWSSSVIPPLGWKDIDAKTRVTQGKGSKSVSLIFKTISEEKRYLFAYMRTPKENDQNPSKQNR